MGPGSAVSELAYEAGKWVGRNVVAPFVRGVLEETTPVIKPAFSLGSLLPQGLRKLLHD